MIIDIPDASDDLRKVTVLAVKASDLRKWRRITEDDAVLGSTRGSRTKSRRPTTSARFVSCCFLKVYFMLCASTL